jgi:hypothetical protein
MSDEKPWEDYTDPLAPAPAKPAPGNLSALVTGQPLPNPEQVGYGEDIVKGAAGGLGRGTAGLVGLPGNLAEYGARGLDYATRKVGEAVGVDVAPRAPQAPTYGSADIQRVMEDYTGKFYEPKTIPGQYASTLGEFAPGMVIPGGGGFAARAFNTVVPAVASETAGQLTKGTAAEPWARGVAGVVSGPLAAKMVTPAAPASAARQAAVSTLDDAGIPLSAGERTGSKPIQWLESTAGDMPFSAGRAAEVKGQQGAAFDRAVTSKVYDPTQLEARGVPPGVSLPDPRVVTAGKQSLSDEYTRLSANPLKSDAQLQNELTGAVTKYEKNVLPSQRTKDVENIRNDITDALVSGQGQIAGDAYQSTRSRLGTLAQGQTNDPYLAGAFKDMRGALDRAMQRGLPASEAEAWALNNTRWGRMKQMEGAVAGAGENLSPVRVAQASRSGRDAQFAAQTDDLDKLSKAASMVLKPPPNSGTAARLGWQQLFGLPGVLAGGGGLLGSAFGPAGTVIGAAAPFAAARAALSRPGQAYLGNQALPQNMRDVIAQTIAQQAISQPSGITRNEAERDYYKKHRPDPLNPQE